MHITKSIENLEKLDILKIGYDLFGKENFKRAGKNAMKSLCPFHKETRPSFFIYSHSQTFICYGCGESGRTLDLIGRVFQDETEMLIYLESQGCDLERDEGVLRELMLG